MKNIIQLDSQHGDLYVAWLYSGHMYGGYGYADGFTAVNQNMLVNALSKSTITESVDKNETPFNTWSFPDRVIKLEVHGHCDLYCMPVDKDVILTVWDDESLGHSVESSSDLKKYVQKNGKTEIVLKSDSPFRTHVSMIKY